MTGTIHKMCVACKASSGLPVLRTQTKHMQELVEARPSNDPTAASQGGCFGSEKPNLDFNPGQQPARNQGKNRR